MKKRTVKRRIFISNTLMIVVTLILFFVINLGVVKIYWESIEHEWEASLQTIAGAKSVEHMIEQWTVHQHSFFLLLLADVIFCIGVWIFVSSVFTGNLVRHIMKPLSALEAGAERIQSDVLTEDIIYAGDTEFETICSAFNGMQAHILREQEKNRKYEEARRDMISGISHDLRTPLTAVRGTIKGLIDGVVTEPELRDKFLRTAYRRTGEMNVLLDQLFYVSKLETGNMPLHIENIDPVSFIKSYAAAKQEILEEEGIEISAETGGCSGTAAADPQQLQRVFDNLLENSRKYAETVPLKIKLALSMTEKGYCIRFSDNGVGVPEEKLDAVFDEFYRADESRNKQEGNGLGLYIIRYLIEAMGGRVRAENAGGFVVSMELRKGES